MQNGNGQAVDAEMEAAIANARGMGLSERDIESHKRKVALIQSRMAKAGGLGLPALLDERRLHYGITDKAWDCQAAYDRVFLFQISQVSGDTYEGSKIILTEQTQKRERMGAPRAVVISAGPGALDSMRSHGIELGHIVYFVVSAPYHIRYDVVAGEAMHLIVVTDGDLVGSEDLATSIKRRETSVAWDEQSGQHLVRYRGENHKPLHGWRAED